MNRESRRGGPSRVRENGYWADKIPKMPTKLRWGNRKKGTWQREKHEQSQVMQSLLFRMRDETWMLGWGAWSPRGLSGISPVTIIIRAANTINSFDPNASPNKWMWSSSPFGEEGNQDTELSSNLPEVTQEVAELGFCDHCGSLLTKIKAKLKHSFQMSLKHSYCEPFISVKIKFSCM